MNMIGRRCTPKRVLVFGCLLLSVTLKAEDQHPYRTLDGLEVLPAHPLSALLRVRHQPPCRTNQ